MEPRDANGLTESEYLAEYAKKSWPRPYLTADVVVFDRELAHVLLIKRRGHPFLGRFALPGGFAEPGETVEQTAARELLEETGVSDAELLPVGLFSAPGRDPRGWVVTQAYTARISLDAFVRAGDDAERALWFALGGGVLRCGDIALRPEQLAFDHAEILAAALRRYM